MASYSPADISYAFIKETQAGILQTTGVAQKIDHVPGNALALTSDALNSPVLGTNRAGGGSTKTNLRVEGSVKTHFQRTSAIDLLISSAFCGSWVETGEVGEGDDVLKAGSNDVSFTVEKTVKGSPTLYSRFNGCQVSKFNLTAEASGNVEATFDIMGMGEVASTTASALTYAPVASTSKLSGLDVKNVSIAGLPGLKFRTLNFTVEQNREAHDTFGQNSAVAIQANGNRTVTLEGTFYRADLQPETVLVGNGAVAVSFEVGEGDNGMRFTIPAANYSPPTSEEDGSKYMVKVTFTAKYDAGSGTDVFATKLT